MDISTNTTLVGGTHSNTPLYVSGTGRVLTLGAGWVKGMFVYAIALDGATFEIVSGTGSLAVPDGATASSANALAGVVALECIADGQLRAVQAAIAPAAPVASVPGAPTGVVLGAATSTTQPLTWAAPASNGGSPLLGYRVGYRLSGSSAAYTYVATGDTTTGRVITGLSAGTAYQYVVEATNAIGVGPASAAQTGSTAAGLVPNATAIWGEIPVAGTINIGSNSGNGRAVRMQHMAPRPFTGIRAVYENWNTAAPLVINAAKVAAAPTHLSTAALAWFAVTYGGSASVTIPAATLSSPNNKIKPGRVISDLVTIASVARTDGGAFPVLLFDTHHPDGSVVATNSSTVAFNSDAANPGFKTASAYNSTAVGGLGAAGVVLQEVNGANSPVAVIYTHASASAGVYDIACFGDSVMLGASTGSNYSGYPHRAAWLAVQQGKYLSVFNGSQNGETHENSHAAAVAFVATYAPKFALLHSWSTNDSGSTSQAAFDAAWARVQTFVSACQAAGTIPIITTPTPQNVGLIAQQCTRVMSLGAGVIKLDLNTLLNGGTPITWRADVANDGVHMGDVGHGLAGAALLTALGI